MPPDGQDEFGNDPGTPGFDPNSAAGVAAAAAQDAAYKTKAPGKITVAPNTSADTQSRRLAEEDKLWQTLRDAKPSFLKDGFGLRGPQQPEVRRTTDFSKGSVVREALKPPFPEDRATAVTQVAGAELSNIAFFLSNATTASGGTTIHKVKVFDGKINGEFPAGMGFGNYVLTVSDSETTLIYAGVTFDPTTLLETSRFLGTSGTGDFPESRVDEDGGFLYWQLGFSYFNVNDIFTIVRTRLGDINFELVYASMNGAPALLPVESGPGFLDLPLT